MHEYFTMKAPMASFGWRFHNFSDMAYSLPRPVVWLLLLVIGIILFGILGNVRKIMRGEGGVSDYMLVIIIFGMLCVIGFVMAKVAFGG